MAEKPQRMCIVCRNMKDKRDLLRVVKNKDGEIFIDQTFKANGRGAYICKSEECVKKCIKTKAFNKAFKCPVAEETYIKISEEALGK